MPSAFLLQNQNQGGKAVESRDGECALLVHLTLLVREKGLTWSRSILKILTHDHVRRQEDIRAPPRGRIAFPSSFFRLRSATWWEEEECYSYKTNQRQEVRTEHIVVPFFFFLLTFEAAPLPCV